MRSKIKLNEQSGRTVAEVFDDFVFAQTAEGLSEVTIRNYKLHLHSISKHLDIQQPMKELTNRQLEEMIVSMRKSGLAHNSISAYARVFRTFLNWCQRQGVARKKRESCEMLGRFVPATCLHSGFVCAILTLSSNPKLVVEANGQFYNQRYAFNAADPTGKIQRQVGTDLPGDWEA